MVFVQVSHIRKNLSRLGIIAFHDQKSRRLRKNKNGRKEQQNGWDYLHSQWYLPLPRLGAGNILIHDVITPEAEHRGELIVDLIETYQASSYGRGTDFRYVLEGGRALAEHGLGFLY